MVETEETLISKQRATVIKGVKFAEPVETKDCPRSKMEQNSKHHLRKVLISITMITSVAFAWTLASQFSQTALRFDKQFDAPFFLMWFNTNFMIICYPVFLLYSSLFTKQTLHEAHVSALKVFGSRSLSLIALMSHILPFVLLWIGANYSFLRALTTVNVAVATSITSCNAAMVYFLAILLLKDEFNVFKLLAVVLAVGGVLLLYFDENVITSKEGLFLSIISAAFAATYKVLFKKIIGDANLAQVSLFMTCLGILNLILGWIPSLTLLFTGVEVVKFESIPWLPLVGAAFLSLLFNFLINFGIALLHPLVISVGMLMGLPLNIAVDVIFRDVKMSLLFLGGSAMIIISFLLIIFPYDLVCQSKKKKKSNATADVEEEVQMITCREPNNDSAPEVLP